MISDPTTALLAIHEAAHAVVAQAVGFPNVLAKINDDRGGTIFDIAVKPDAPTLHRYLLALVAGHIAEDLFISREDREYVGRQPWTEWGSDGRLIDETLNKLGGDPHERLERARGEATAILAMNWTALQAIRDDLAAGKVVNGKSASLQMVHQRPKGTR